MAYQKSFRKEIVLIGNKRRETADPSFTLLFSFGSIVSLENPMRRNKTSWRGGPIIKAPWLRSCKCVSNDRHPIDGWLSGREDSNDWNNRSHTQSRPARAMAHDPQPFPYPKPLVRVSSFACQLPDQVDTNEEGKYKRIKMQGLLFLFLISVLSSVKKNQHSTSDTRGLRVFATQANV